MNLSRYICGERAAGFDKSDRIKAADLDSLWLFKQRGEIIFRCNDMSNFLHLSTSLKEYYNYTSNAI